MKTINLDGKKYVDMSDYLKLQTDVESLKDELSKKPKDTLKGLGEMKVHVFDETITMGMGSVQLGSDYIKVRISMLLLTNALKSLKAISCNARGDVDKSVVIALATDMPMVIGNVNKKKNEISGVIIAPRISEE